MNGPIARTIAQRALPLLGLLMVVLVLAGGAAAERAPDFSATTLAEGAEVSLAEESYVGWSVLVTCRIEGVTVGDEDGPVLGHRRGRFFRLGSDA